MDDKLIKVRITVTIAMDVEVPAFNAETPAKLHGYAVGAAANALANVVTHEAPTGLIIHPETGKDSGTWTVSELPAS